MSVLGALGAFRERHRVVSDLTCFVLGFLFDLTFVGHIDSRPMLIQQAIYIVLLTILIGVDHSLDVRGIEMEGTWGRILRLREWILHFFLGTLLNASLIFYVKSASSLLNWDFVFVVVIAVLLIVNETPRFRALGPVIRVALLSFVSTSFLTWLLPVLFGFLSTGLFFAAVGLGAAQTLFVWRAYAAFTHDPGWTFRRAALPGLACQALMIALYLLHVVPPVPLAVRFIGVYHEVRADGAHHRLYHLPQRFRFRDQGDLRFLARPGDRVTMFARIFAPRNFHDRMSVRWSYYDEKARAWTETDAIPLTITGGLEEGWRAVAYKENYQPGEWRVQIEASDERAVGHLKFTIEDDPGTGPRAFAEDVR